jgi:plastocyanin
VRVRLAAFAIAVSCVVVACGGGGGGASSYKEPKGPAKQTVTIKAGNLFFDPKQVDLPAGVDAIKLQNTGGSHTLVIDGVNGFKLKVSGEGATDQLKVDLKPGKYTFYCDIPGHREGGMEGKLTVK